MMMMNSFQETAVREMVPQSKAAMMIRTL